MIRFPSLPRRTLHLSVVAASSLVLLLTSSLIGVSPASAAPTVDAAAGGRVHASGLVVLGKMEFKDIGPNPKALGDALDRIEYISERNAEDLAHPWVDRTTGRIVIGAVTDAGVSKAQQWKYLDAKLKSVSPHVPRVRFSRAQLEQIEDEVHDLKTAGVPDADLIWMSYAEPEHNRIVITVERESAALLQSLANRYGTEAIAVRVDPHRARASQPTTKSRDFDYASFHYGFYGDAYIDVRNRPYCSNAFGWDVRFEGVRGRGILTAGHCAPLRNGGADGWFVYAGRRGVYSADYYLGYVNWRTTWVAGMGTNQLGIDATPREREDDRTLRRGDMALIESPSRNIDARIFRGGVNSESSSAVKEMWHWRAQRNDQHCIGGVRTGEKCGYVVTHPRVHVVTYASGEILRNAVAAHKGFGMCNQGGDSGGAVYTVRADGTIAAKGIFSGFNGLATGTAQNPCLSWFTDIWSAHWGFPGKLLTR